MQWGRASSLNQQMSAHWEYVSATHIEPMLHALCDALSEYAVSKCVCYMFVEIMHIY